MLKWPAYNYTNKQLLQMVLIVCKECNGQFCLLYTLIEHCCISHVLNLIDGLKIYGGESDIVVSAIE